MSNQQTEVSIKEYGKPQGGGYYIITEESFRDALQSYAATQVARERDFIKLRLTDGIKNRSDGAGGLEDFSWREFIDEVINPPTP